MKKQRIIGVDFGTSTSVIRVKRYEDEKIIGEKLETKDVTFNSNSIVPTMIMEKDDDPSVVYYGYEARTRRKKFTQYHGFKMNLESKDVAKREEARDLTEKFFDYMAKTYIGQSEGGHLGDADDEQKTVISYPVKWSDETKQFMIDAAKKAKFPNVEGMDEAQAAIQAVIVQNTEYLVKQGILQDEKAVKILLVDMGAGTTDLVLCKYYLDGTPRKEVISTWPKDGEINFGGRDIDNHLQDYFRGIMDEKEAEIVLSKVVTDHYKSWKEEVVSPALFCNDSVSNFDAIDRIADILEIELSYDLDRKAFETCMQSYLKQFPVLVAGCLNDAGIKGDEIDLVILTGGNSQWYFVREMLEGNMPQFGEITLSKIQKDPGRIISITRPQETVALGLAYSGASIAEFVDFPINEDVVDVEDESDEIVLDEEIFEEPNTIHTVKHYGELVKECLLKSHFPPAMNGINKMDALLLRRSKEYYGIDDSEEIYFVNRYGLAGLFSYKKDPTCYFYYTEKGFYGHYFEKKFFKTTKKVNFIPWDKFRDIVIADVYKEDSFYLMMNGERTFCSYCNGKPEARARWRYFYQDLQKYLRENAYRIEKNQ